MEESTENSTIPIIDEVIEEINSTLENISNGLSFISKSEGDIFDLIAGLFAVILIILACLGCTECLNTAFIDKTRKKNKLYFQKLNDRTQDVQDL